LREAQEVLEGSKAGLCFCRIESLLPKISNSGHLTRYALFCFDNAALSPLQWHRM
jgi:hypothetical protein